MAQSSSSDDSRRFFVCPVCRRWYEEGVRRCPDHDVELQLAKRPPGSLIGENLDGRYFIDGIIGEGGMGMVYTAVQQPIGRSIAVKVLKPELTRDKTVVSRFYKEAQAASALANPNSITVHDFGQASDGSLYIAMELLEGATLGELLENGPMPPEHVIAIAVQVTRALTEAHRKGIVHRDLKPENIMLLASDDGSILAKVLDFGIAKILKPIAPSPAGEPVTREGRIIGTPRYMAPEIARGHPPVPTSDLYSLGVILFEMLAGVPPFDDENPIVLLGMHIKDPPPALVSPFLNMPPQLEQLVTQLLEKKAEARPQSVDDVHSLLKLLHGETYISATAILGEAARGITGSHRIPPEKTHPEAATFDVAETARFDAVQSPQSAHTTTDVDDDGPARSAPPPAPALPPPIPGPAKAAPETIPFDAVQQPQRGGVTTFTAVRRRWIPGLIVAVVVLLLVSTLVIVGLRYYGSPTSTQGSSAAAPHLAQGQVSELIGADRLPAQPDASNGRAPIVDSTISTQITSTPAGAVVTIGTEHLCQTPCRANLDAGEAVRLRFRLRGYRSETVLHTPQEGHDVSVSLTSIEHTP